MPAIMGDSWAPGRVGDGRKKGLRGTGCKDRGVNVCWLGLYCLLLLVVHKVGFITILSSLLSFFVIWMLFRLWFSARLILETYVNLFALEIQHCH